MPLEEVANDLAYLGAKPHMNSKTPEQAVGMWSLETSDGKQMQRLCSLLMQTVFYVGVFLMRCSARIPAKKPSRYHPNRAVSAVLVRPSHLKARTVRRHRPSIDVLPLSLYSYRSLRRTCAQMVANTTLHAAGILQEVWAYGRHLTA